MMGNFQMIAKCFLCVLILGGGVDPARAQEKDSAEAPVAFRMVCLSHAAGKTELHLGPAHVKSLTTKREAGKDVPVKPAVGALTLPRNNLSPWMRARPVNNELVFYLRPVGEEGAGDAEIPKVAARAVLPSGITGEVLLLFVAAPPSGNYGLAYRVAVIDAGKRAFPAGSHLLYNLTASQVRGRLAQNGFVLNPGQRHLVGEIKTSHPRGYFEVVLEQKNPTSGTAAPWERLARTQWKEDETARRLCLLFDDPARGRVAMRTFNEYLIAIRPPTGLADPLTNPGDGFTKETANP